MQIREKEREREGGPRGQFLIAMSNKQNEVVKFIGEEQRILCEKIITLHLQSDESLIHHYEGQLQAIQDYLQRLHHLPSAIATHEHLQIYRIHAPNRLVLKIVTRFWEYPTFEDFLRREAIRGEQMQRNGRLIMHFLEEFMQLLLRAGGIDRYFYTPRNIFLIQPQAGERLQPLGKLKLNLTSLAGLKLLINNSRIIREDFCEVYPLLPPDFLHLRSTLTPKDDNYESAGICRRNERELDSIIRKRALGWLITCLILRKVPELLEPNKMAPLVDKTTIETSLNASARLFGKILSLLPFRKLLDQAQQETGINFVELLTLIFVTPYPEKAEDKPRDFRFISWAEIYRRIFQENKFARKEGEHDDQVDTDRYFQRMLWAIWEMQPQKEYYLERDFATDDPEKPQSMVYFLTKINCNFHKLLRYRNVCQLLLKERFSEDSSQIVTKLAKIFSESQQKQEDDAQIPHESDRTKESSSLYDPFMPKSRKELSILQQQSSSTTQEGDAFMGKLARMPQMLQSVSSLDFVQRESGKNIVNISEKQTILTEFCTSLWPM